MSEGEIIEEIRRVREQIGAEFDFDPRRLGEEMRRLQREEEARGVRYVSFAKNREPAEAAPVVREEPEA